MCVYYITILLDSSIDTGKTTVSPNEGWCNVGNIVESNNTEGNVCPNTSLGSRCCIALTNLEIHGPCIKLLAPLRLPCLEAVNAVELVGWKRDTQPVESKTGRGTHTKQRQFVGHSCGHARSATRKHTHKTHARKQHTVPRRCQAPTILRY